MSGNPHRDAVDALVEQRAHFVIKAAVADSNLWHAEFQLHRCAKLLPRLIAEHPADAVARDTLVQEIREFLTEPRDHPGAGVVNDAHWLKTPSVGAGEAPTEGTTT